MSLLIKGMEMPQGCDQCRRCVPDDVNSDSTLVSPRIALCCVFTIYGMKLH